MVEKGSKRLWGVQGKRKKKTRLLRRKEEGGKDTAEGLRENG